MTASTSFHYVGNELDLFELATNWKAYWQRAVAPYVRGEVLEVGAGTGTNTLHLVTGRTTSFTALEPDGGLAARIRPRVEGRWPALPLEVVVGTLVDLEPDRVFDTILYIDVLEHVEDDRGELARAVQRLRPGGAVVVLAPAHQRLYSPFDRAIGHFRRYDASMFRALSPPGATLTRLFYLDAVGLAASAANAMVLRASMPSASQVRFWDRVLVPCSRLVDRLLGRTVGKSVIGVWVRDGAA